eukprot:Sspe_Gene.18061::Locus_6465_Transcript_1_1_Confidence_1.000_Length_992::g.18061::m.18061
MSTPLPPMATLEDARESIRGVRLMLDAVEGKLPSLSTGLMADRQALVENMRGELSYASELLAHTLAFLTAFTCSTVEDERAVGKYVALCQAQETRYGTVKRALSDALNDAHRSGSMVAPTPSFQHSGEDSEPSNEDLLVRDRQQALLAMRKEAEQREREALSEALERKIQEEQEREMAIIAKSAAELARLSEETQQHVEEAQPALDQAQESLDTGLQRTRDGNRELLGASKAKVGSAMLSGAIVGGIVGGPIGFAVAGLSGAAIAGASAVGALTGGFVARSAGKAKHKKNVETVLNTTDM